MSDLQEKVRRVRQEGFLTRVFQVAQGDPTHRLNAGALGMGMGLPLETTLSIVETLQEEGLLHRCGKLNPPDGPEIHLTRRGVDRVRRAA